jgi:hypothetical protein
VSDRTTGSEDKPGGFSVRFWPVKNEQRNIVGVVARRQATQNHTAGGLPFGGAQAKHHKTLQNAKNKLPFPPAYMK